MTRFKSNSPMEPGTMGSMGELSARSIRNTLATLAAACLLMALPVAPHAQAYGDGTAALCRVSHDRTGVTTADANASVESIVCFYELQYGAVIMYPIVKVQSRQLSGSDVLLTNCSITYETLDSRGYPLGRGSFMAYGPIFPFASYYAQIPIYFNTRIAEVKVQGVTCSKSTRPRGLYSGYSISVGAPTQGQFQKVFPVTFTNTGKDEYTLTGEITYRAPSYSIVGIVDIVGTGCSPRNMTLKAGETKTCYFQHPDYTTNPNFPYTISDYRYQGTHQIAPARIVTYPTISGRPKVKSQLTATRATTTGDTSGFTAWWTCSTPVRSPGTGEPPRQCKSLGNATGLTYRVRARDIGKHLIVKNYARGLAGEINSYSKSIGPVRR